MDPASSSSVQELTTVWQNLHLEEEYAGGLEATEEDAV